MTLCLFSHTEVYLLESFRCAWVYYKTEEYFFILSKIPAYHLLFRIDLLLGPLLNSDWCNQNSDKKIWKFRPYFTIFTRISELLIIAQLMPLRLCSLSQPSFNPNPKLGVTIHSVRNHPPTLPTPPHPTPPGTQSCLILP